MATQCIYFVKVHRVSSMDVCLSVINSLKNHPKPYYLEITAVLVILQLCFTIKLSCGYN